ncbi:MAG: RNHCP domain-containing protein, partial [bacterium]
SRHCDVNPGDRACSCLGLMEPMGVEIVSGEYAIYYQCAKCGFKHRVKSAKDDNFEEIIKLSKGYA